jgi:hypothetical protein
VSAPSTDVHRTLAYSDAKVNKQLLLVALALCGVGVLFVTIYATYAIEYKLGWVMAAAGVGLAVYAHFRLFNPGKPLLVLSPNGLLLRTVGKDIFIPWHEVRGVDAIHFKSWTAVYTSLPPVPVPVKFRNVTVVLVSRDFYEDELVSAYPALVHHRVWGRTFIPKGNLVQVALHHDILPVEPEELRRQVAARLYAFRNAEPAAATASAPDGGTVVDNAGAPPAASQRPAGGRKIRFRISREENGASSPD